MDDKLNENIFLVDRSSYLTAERLQLIIIIVLIVFHALVLSPFYSARRENLGIEKQIGTTRQVEEAVSSIQTDLATFRGGTVEAAKAKLQATKRELFQQFDDLNCVVSSLSQLKPEQAAGPDGADIFSRPCGAQQVQQQLYPPQIPVIPPPTRQAVAQAQIYRDHDQILQVMDSYIEKQLVQPSFASFNAAWRSDVVPGARATAQALYAKLDAAVGRYPTYANVWTTTKNEIQKLLATAEAVTLREPNEAHWWRTRQAKEVAINEPLFAISDVHVLDSLDEVSKIAAQEKALDEQLERGSELSRKVLEEQEEAFKKQQELLGEFLEPLKGLKGIGFDLKPIAQCFPTILGLVLACTIAWMAAQLRQLSETVTVLSPGDRSPIPSRWLEARLARTRSGNAVKMVLFLIWIVLSGVQLGSSGTEGQAVVLLKTAAGVLAVLSASYYQWRTVRLARVSTGSASEVAPTPPNRTPLKRP
ncbi:MAG TPA: hypothetical protein VKG91_03160 [Roseiarcus sp.]|nr:hypothetical protein [Roseiarcus sp.]